PRIAAIGGSGCSPSRRGDDAVTTLLLRAVAPLVLFLPPGLALAALFRVRSRGVPRLGWAYLFGIAYLGGALFALSHAAAFPLRRGPVLAVALVPVFAALGVRLAWPRRRAAPPRARAAASGLDAA